MQEETRPKVSLSILTYNRSEILRELLDSLVKLEYEPLEIIVVDNHSTDGTEEIVKASFSQVQYFRMSANMGVEARNVGLKAAAGDIIITLDDDVLGVSNSDIMTLTSLFKDCPDIGAVCFKVLDYWSGNICNWCHHYKREDYSEQRFITDEISEGAVAFRRSIFMHSGYYPGRFFISYEGADLCCRMLNVGYKTMYCPSIVVKHKHAKQGRPDWRRYYYDTRNQIWFVARNYPVTWAIRYLMRGLGAMLLYSLRDGFFRYWLRGVWDGIRALPTVVRERECITDDKLEILRYIASHKPGIVYMLKKRLFQREVRI